VLVAPFMRVAPPGVRLLQIPLWNLARSAANRLAEPLAVKLAIRKTIDLVLSKIVPKTVAHIFATSLTAQRTFSRASWAKKTLISDLPQLKQLHLDLDLARSLLPHCRYLHHHRAASSDLIQQAEEYVLADTVLVRSHFAQTIVQRCTSTPIQAMPSAPSPKALLFEAQGPVLLAGNAASRNGLEMALAGIERRKGFLLARPAAGSELSSLRHPQLKLLQVHQAIPPVAAVWAPAWTESTPIEVPQALAANIPVVASNRALGWIQESQRLKVIQPGVAL
jgi:hypothetical protein